MFCACSKHLSVPANQARNTGSFAVIHSEGKEEKASGVAKVKMSLQRFYTGVMLPCPSEHGNRSVFRVGGSTVSYRA
jgi:hypothetical protein